MFDCCLGAETAADQCFDEERDTRLSGWEGLQLRVDQRTKLKPQSRWDVVRVGPIVIVPTTGDSLKPNLAPMAHGLISTS